MGTAAAVFYKPPVKLSDIIQGLVQSLFDGVI